MPEEKKRKVGSGRLKGSVSLIETELGFLLPHLTPKSRIVIGRKWLEDRGIDIPVWPHKRKPLSISEPEPEEEQKPEMQITTFND